MATEKPLAPCACGCGTPTRSKYGPGGYFKGHRPSVTRDCEVCGDVIQYKWRADRAASLTRCRSCAPLRRRVARNECPTCGTPVRNAQQKYCSRKCVPHETAHMKPGSPEWRARVVPKIKQLRSKDIIVNGLPAVARALRAKGIKAKDLQIAFGISNITARQTLSPVKGHKNISRERAEVLLRFAAGLPYAPTARQQQLARKQEWNTRGKQKDGVRKYTPKPTAAFEHRFDGALKKTEHLKDPTYTKRKWAHGDYVE